MIVLRFEARVVRAAVLRVVSSPSRRALWAASGGIIGFAIVVDLVTSGMATRDLGGWHASPVVVIASIVAILALALAVGPFTPLSYGTRVADAVWWRYAGIARDEGERSTVVIVSVRAFAAVAAIALPLGGAFALAVPDRAGILVGLALGTSLLAPISVALTALTAGRERGGGVAQERLPHSAPVARLVCSRIPRGLPAARWLVARRRGASFVPFAAVALGALAGFAASRASALVNPEFLILAAVVGSVAAFLGAAIVQADGVETLTSPWWRTALGTGPRAILGWAVAATLPATGFLAAFVVALAAAFGALSLGIAAIPLAVGGPVTLRLASLAVGTTFPAAGDRHGAASGLRVAAAAALVVGVAASLPLASSGTFAVLATATVACGGAGALALSWAGRQLARG